jgi:O-antigen/teichoic acid export membrane protein
VSTALCNTLYVKVIYWTVEKDYTALSVSLEKAVTYSLVFALPILAGGIILGERLLYYFYGAGFAAGYLVLIIIIFMRVFQSMSQLFVRYLMSANRVRSALAGVFAGIVVNILLAFILIPKFGLAGAALACLADVLIIVTVSSYSLNCIFPVRFEMKRISIIIIFSIIMAAFLVILDIIFTTNSAFITVARVAAGAAVYCTAILMYDSQIREDVFRIVKIRWIPQK